MDFRNNKDFWAGSMFIVIGAATIFAAWNYPFGTTLRMGPGYFPTVLSGILILLGIFVAVEGLYKKNMIKGNWSLRALIILPLAVVLFGVLIKYTGFVPAIVVTVMVSSASCREFKLIDTLLVTVLLAIFSVAVFVWGLGLPYDLINF